MFKPIWIIGFTGHRPGSGPGRTPEMLGGCRPSLREVLARLRQRAESQGGVIELLTGVAAGADLEAAEVAEELDIPVHVILPTPEILFERDFEGDLVSDWPRAKRLIQKARGGEGGCTFRIAVGDNDPPDCYHEANVQMLQSTDLLIAVYNGEHSESVGGTAETIGLAKGLDIPVVQVNPAQGGKIIWPEPFDHWPATDGAMREVMRVCEQAGAGSMDTAEGIFTALDTEATCMGKRFRGGMLGSVYLHLLAALFAATTAAFSSVMNHEASEILTGLELFLVTVAFIIMIRAHRGDYHQRWRRTRFATEVARGLRATAGLLDPIRPLVLRHAPEWRRVSLTMALATHRSADRAEPITDRKAEYLEGRICDQADHYFALKQPRSLALSKWLGGVGSVTAITAPIFIGLALGIKIFGGDPVAADHFARYVPAFVVDMFTPTVIPTFTFWFPVVLPLLAGSATALIVAGDVTRRAERYKLIFGRLEHSRRLLNATRTPGAVARAVAETEEILLYELVEWYAAAKNTGH